MCCSFGCAGQKSCARAVDGGVDGLDVVRMTGGASAGVVQGTRRVLEQCSCAGSKECRLQHGRGAWARPALLSRREAPRQGPITDADPAFQRFKSANQAAGVLGMVCDWRRGLLDWTLGTERWYGVVRCSCASPGIPDLSRARLAEGEGSG